MRIAHVVMATVLALGVSTALSDTLKDGTIEYSADHYLAGEEIPVGFDDYGYNYQAHLFKGSYANVYLGGAGFPPYEGDDEEYLDENPSAESHWAWPYREIKLSMKWNDAWISNQDRDGDGKLDRHYGYDTYVGSGAWLTNHMSGRDANGKKWTYFTKIVAAPSTATLDDGVWYDRRNREIGPVIWGQFATIQEIDTESGYRYKSPAGPGFGKYGAE